MASIKSSSVNDVLFNDPAPLRGYEGQLMIIVSVKVGIENTYCNLQFVVLVNTLKKFMKPHDFVTMFLMSVRRLPHTSLYYTINLSECLGTHLKLSQNHPGVAPENFGGGGVSDMIFFNGT